MIGRTNASLSSGGQVTGYSSILVWYPVGYECVCMHGGTILTAEDTSGYYVFHVPEKGSWTIFCDEEAGYEAQTVTVSDFGTIQCVKLLPTGLYHPINNGVISTLYTFAFQKQHNSCSYEITADGPKIHSPAASGSWCEGYFEEPIPIEKWMTKLIVRYTGRGYALCVGLKKDPTASFTSASASYAVYSNGGQATQRTNYTVALDINKVTKTAGYDSATYYFAFRTAGSGASNYQGNMTLHDLYFE